MENFPWLERASRFAEREFGEDDPTEIHRDSLRVYSLQQYIDAKDSIKGKGISLICTGKVYKEIMGYEKELQKCQPLPLK